MLARATRAHTGARQPDVAPVEGNFFVTHPQVTRALLRVETFPGVVWEPACGDGTMARELTRGAGTTKVISSDKHDRGYGVTGIDFLRQTSLYDEVNHIVTNPPFELAREFVDRALDLRPSGKVAMFLRLAWLEGKTRHRGLWSIAPPVRVWVFANRVPLRRNGGPWQAGLIAFAWFIWESGANGETRLGWLPDLFKKNGTWIE